MIHTEITPTDSASTSSAPTSLPGVQAIAKRLGKSARASTVFGSPVSDGASIIVPVARATWGFGGGSGPDGKGSGAGGGLHLRPVGYIKIHNGQTRFRRIGLPWGLLAGAALAGAAVATVAAARLTRSARHKSAKA